MLLDVLGLQDPGPAPAAFAEGVPLLLDLLSLMEFEERSVLLPNPRRTLFSGRDSGGVMPDFDEIEPGERDVFTFDITRELRSEETPTAVTWGCALAKTLDGFSADASAAERVLSTPNIGYELDSITAKKRWFTNGLVGEMVDGNYYFLRATIDIGPTGRMIKRYARVLCADESYFV